MPVGLVLKIYPTGEWKLAFVTGTVLATSKSSRDDEPIGLGATVRPYLIEYLNKRQLTIPAM